MSDIYINEATGKKIKLYKQTMVHVYDHDDPRDILDFRDTIQGVAEWCYENIDEDHDHYKLIKKAYDNEKWKIIIEMTDCRYCDYDFEDEWIVEEIENDD